MDALEAIRGRRAINFFDTGYKLEDGALEEMLSIASLAPSSFNLQPWHVVAVTTAEGKAALRKCAMNQPKVEEASVMLIIVADPRAFEDHFDMLYDKRVEAGQAKEAGREKVRSVAAKLYGEPDGMTRAVFAAKNAGLFAMNIMIAARGMGLETHPMDGFDSALVKQEFGIPEDKIVPMLIAVGRLRPDATLAPRNHRRPVSEFLRHGKFGR